jgi:hypothetical protein
MRSLDSPELVWCLQRDGRLGLHTPAGQRVLVLFTHHNAALDFARRFCAEGGFVAPAQPLSEAVLRTTLVLERSLKGVELACVDPPHPHQLRVVPFAAVEASLRRSGTLAARLRVLSSQPHLRIISTER